MRDSSDPRASNSGSGPNPYAGWLWRVRSTSENGSSASSGSSSGGRAANSTVSGGTPWGDPRYERRIYAVLIGPYLYEYGTEDEASADSMAPRSALEVIGVSASPGPAASALAWSRPTSTRFLLVSRCGTIYQAAAASEQGKLSWVAAATAGLNAVLDVATGSGEAAQAAAAAVAAAAASAPVPLPQHSTATVCLESGEAFSLTQPRYNCMSCGGAFVSELVTRDAPLPHHGAECGLRTCDSCRAAQECAFALQSASAVLLVYRRNLATAAAALPPDLVVMGSESPGASHENDGEQPSFNTGSALGPLGAPSPLLLEGLAAGAGNSEASLPKSTRRHLGFWLRCGPESAGSRSTSTSGNIVASPAAIQAASAAAMSLRAHAFQLAHARDFVGLSRVLYVHRGPFASMGNLGSAADSSGSNSSSSTSTGPLNTPGTGAAMTSGRWASSESGGIGGLGSVKGSLMVFASILDAFSETVDLGWPSQSHGHREAAIDFVLPQILQIYFLLLGPPPNSSTNSTTSSTTATPATVSSDSKTTLSASASRAASQRSSDGPDSETNSLYGERVEEGEEHYGYAGGRVLTSMVETAVRLELLRAFILKLCSQSLSIAVKVVWSLLGHLEDAHMTPDLGPTGTLEDRRLRSKKAGLALLMLEVEATIAEAGRPLGCCFGESRGLFPRLLKPTPGQMAVLVGQAAVLESSRLRLGCSNPPNESVTSRMLHPPAPPAPVSGAENPEPSPQRWRRRRAASNNSDRDSDNDECSPISSPRVLASTPTKIDYAAGAISTSEPLSSDVGSGEAAETSKKDAEASTEASTDPLSPREPLSPPVGADAFYKQLTFTARLTDLAERMRFVEPKARAERLRTELDILNRDAEGLGYFPMGGPLCPVIRIPAAEGYVFKTKARAPTLVLFEILRHSESLSLAEKGTDISPNSDTSMAEVAANAASFATMESKESFESTIPEREVDWALGPFEQDASDDSAVADTVESLVSRVVDSATMATEPAERRLDEIKEGTVSQSSTAAVRVLEVESLIGDQIERRLTRSASLQDHSLDGDDEFSVNNDDATSLHCEFGSGSSSSDTPSVSSACADDARVPLPRSLLPSLPNQDEVRGFVRSHSGKLPLSQLAMLGEEEEEDNKVAANNNSESTCGSGGKLNESKALESQQLDLEYAAAAAAAATASSIVRGVDSRGGGRPNSPAAVGVAAKTAVAKATEGVVDSRGAESSAAGDNATSLVASTNAARRGKRAAASEAVLCARELYANGQISAEELETLIAKDTEFQVQIEESLAEDERFLLSAAFGESWAQKKKRIQAESPEGQRPGWDLVGMIVKSNDDLRQEVCALQLIELSRQLFEHAELPLFLRSYTIISTDASTGLIEILTDAISIDALKKRQIQHLQEATDQSAYVPSGVGLAHHFEATYGPADSVRGREARRRFASSLAAYSAVSYAFAIKDRHNGNILLDTDGHLIHIDFGFLLGIAPGGAFSIETAPFKLTDETVQVLGGVSSKLFADFVLLFSCAFLVLQAGVDQIAGVVGIMCDESPFPCFAGVAEAEVLAKLKQRLRPDLDRRASVGFAIDLIRQSMGSTLTRQYDNFQWLTNGIMP